MTKRATAASARIGQRQEHGWDLLGKRLAFSAHAKAKSMISQTEKIVYRFSRIDVVVCGCVTPTFYSHPKSG